jgi:hypothetical protein
MNDASHHGRGLACRQLLQGDGPEHYSNLLNPSSENLSDGFLIIPGYLKVDGTS